MKKVFAFVIMTLSLYCFAQNDANEIIEQFKQKFLKYDSITSMKATYKTTFYNEETTYSSTIKIISRGQKIKTEITSDSDEFKEVQQLSTTIIKDGNNIYLINPITGKVKIKDEDKNNYLQDKGTQFWKLNFDDYVYNGIQEINKTQTYLFSKKDDKNSKIFIDKKNLFVVQQQEISKSDTLLLSFENYKKIQSDYFIPHTIILKINGKKIMLMELKNIIINPKVDDSEFEVKEDKSIDIQELMKNLGQ